MLSEVDAMPLDLTPEAEGKRHEVLSLLADAMCDAGRCPEADGVRAAIGRGLVPQHEADGDSYAWWRVCLTTKSDRIAAATISKKEQSRLTGHRFENEPSMQYCHFRGYETPSEAYLALAKVLGGCRMTITDTVTAILSTIDEGDYDALPFLADALEDSGDSVLADGVRVIAAKGLAPQKGTYGHAWWRYGSDPLNNPQVRAAWVSLTAFDELVTENRAHEMAGFRCYASPSEAVMALAQVAGQGVAI